MMPIAAPAGGGDGLTGPATVALVLVTVGLVVVTYLVARRAGRVKARPRLSLAAYEAPTQAGQAVYVAISNVGGYAAEVQLDVGFTFADGQGSSPLGTLRGASLDRGQRLWFAAPASGYGERPMSLAELHTMFSDLHANAVFRDMEDRSHRFEERIPIMSLRCSRLSSPPDELGPAA